MNYKSFLNSLKIFDIIFEKSATQFATFPKSLIYSLFQHFIILITWKIPRNKLSFSVKLLDSQENFTLNKFPQSQKWFRENLSNS